MYCIKAINNLISYNKMVWPSAATKPIRVTVAFTKFAGVWLPWVH